MAVRNITPRIKAKALYNLIPALRHLDDKTYLKLFYFIFLGRRLNLRSPSTFNEKLQWLKLYDRRTMYTTMVDKYSAKKWVSEVIGSQYVIPTLGIWDTFDDIDFSRLPRQFVLKCTHDSGSAIMCRDRSTFDLELARKRLSRSLARNFYLIGREWPYKNVKPRILAETLLPGLTQTAESSGSSESAGHPRRRERSIIDYKFFCFHGVPRFLNVQQDMHDGRQARFMFVNLDWTICDFGRTDYAPYACLPPKPRFFDQMVCLAKRLSKGLPFIRIDFFDGVDNALFSEATLYPTSGVIPFSPHGADRRLGSWISLAENSR